MPSVWKPFNIHSYTQSFDIEFLKREIGQRFPFYDMRDTGGSLVFFCRIDEATLEDHFESLRTTLSSHGYIPLLRYEAGEHKLYIIEKPQKKFRPVWVNILLLITTIATTTLAGSLQWASLYETEFIALFSPQYLLDGFIYFSLPLLSILGIHEMGHYLASKRHHVDASLPFFIPLPPPFILGTLGAFISTREPIPNRKALLDIGVAGPLCGFCVALPVAFLGLFFMQTHPISIPVEPGTGIVFFYPLVLQFLDAFFTIPSDAILHPTAFAGWVGFFITALNLLPIGQLDGGHVSRALFKEKSRYVTWVTVLSIMALGMYVLLFTGFGGWLFFLIFILFLVGTRHPAPLNELSELDTNRKIIGVVALLVFILCFAPIPLAG
jgi:membrane-associated protease RseP (regulator of RpoE activity)